MQSAWIASPSTSWPTDMGLASARHPASGRLSATARFAQLTAAERSAAAAAFSADERDSMTPAAMTDLLVKIMTPGLLSARHRSVLLEIMQRCQTGAGAIRGMLPPETPVAHKTGTLAEVV